MGFQGILNMVYTIVLGGGARGDVKAAACDCKPVQKEAYKGNFQMPVHYPRYKKGDYEKMEEWKVDCLLREFGLSFNGSLQEKRDFAMGAFLWSHQMVD